MSQFAFPAWVEESPSVFYLRLGPRSAGLKISYRASAMVIAEIDAQGPFWQAFAPVLGADGWKTQKLAQRFASAADAKAAVEAAIVAAPGQELYDVPAPRSASSITVNPGAEVLVGGRPVELDPADRERLLELGRQVTALVCKPAVLTMLDDLKSQLCDTGSPVQ